MKTSITYHFLRCILWIFRINWPVAIIKAEGHSLFSWVPSAIKPTVNLTTEGKEERPIHFEADQKVSILKLTGSLSRICIVENKWQIVYLLFNFLWCLDWGGDIHDAPAEAFLLRGSFTTAKVFQGANNKYNLIFTSYTYWQLSSITLLIFLCHSSISLRTTPQKWGSKWKNKTSFLTAQLKMQVSSPISPLLFHGCKLMLLYWDCTLQT